MWLKLCITVCDYFVFKLTEHSFASNLGVVVLDL